jgi:hypothetical protein
VASATCGTLFPTGWCGLAGDVGRTDTASTNRFGWMARKVYARSFIEHLTARNAEAAGNRSLEGPFLGSTRISASNAARDRNSPIKAHQINLQRSLIDRTIDRFAGVSQLFRFVVA